MSRNMVDEVSIVGKVTERIIAIGWKDVAGQLHNGGYAIIGQFLTPEQCVYLRDFYDQPSGYRKMVVMERFRFGQGEYKYFDYPLPDVVQAIRTRLYPGLVPIANQWMDQLNIKDRFPESHEVLLNQCGAKGQMKPTPLILKYGRGGFNTLHRDLYGEVYFPLQAVILLSDPDVDFTGGEFVLTQQNPRAQSKAIVLRPRMGDMIIFTTNIRPVAGRKGFYRAAVRHGISEVKSGQRFTLGIIFHDASG